MVYAVILRCGFDEDEAAVLFHEVWLAARDELGTAPDDSGVAGWLAALAARQARRALRHRSQPACSPDGRDEAGR